MLNYKIPPAQVTRHSRSMQVKEWLTSQKELASRYILVVIEADRIMIHATADGEWLANLDWSGKAITVTDAQNVGLPYNFRGFKSAFTFLDAFLLHQFIKTAAVWDNGGSAAGASLSAS